MSEIKTRKVHEFNSKWSKFQDTLNKTNECTFSSWADRYPLTNGPLIKEFTDVLPVQMYSVFRTLFFPFNLLMNCISDQWSLLFICSNKLKFFVLGRCKNYFVYAGKLIRSYSDKYWIFSDCVYNTLPFWIPFYRTERWICTLVWGFWYAMNWYASSHPTPNLMLISSLIISTISEI